MFSSKVPVSVARGLLVWASLLIVGSTLVACGDGEPPSDPLAPFRAQVLDWQPCDPTIFEKDYEVLARRLGSRVQCAAMRAPLDYANPATGEVVVALARVTAADPAARRGSLLFNPGGPGNDGLYLSVLYGSFWGGANPEHPVAKLYLQLAQSYDLVGFSPRGTGASTRLYCGSNEQLPFVANPSADRSSGNVKAMLDSARVKADACGKNPLTRYITTDATARDLELMRQVLREEKLNFHFTSYGTWLASWYASLFPERVGRMLLIGNMNFTVGFDGNMLPQAMGQQRVLDDVLAPYAARHDNMFHLGKTTEEVRTVFGSLSSTMQDAAEQEMTGAIRIFREADATLAILHAVQMMDAWLKKHPGADEAALVAMIATTSFVTDPELNRKAVAGATSIAGRYFSLLRRTTHAVELLPEDAVFWAVVCNDVPMHYDVAAWIAANDLAALHYPFAGGRDTENPCLYWGWPAEQRPALDAMTRAGGIVMLNSQFDPLTTLEGARASLAALPNASFIQVDGEYTHALAVPYGVACIDQPVADYLLYGRQPARDTSCIGQPLPADEAVAVKAARAEDRMHAAPVVAATIRRQIETILNRAQPSGR